MQYKRGHDRLRRKIENSPTRKKIYIFCDDTKTAVNYFIQCIKSSKLSHLPKPFPAPHHGVNLDQLIQNAWDTIRKSGGFEPGDSAWLLVDTEGKEHTLRQARIRKSSLKKKQLRILISHPCFEVWTLLHLVESCPAFHNCQQVIKRIGIEWKIKFNQEFGPKEKAQYSLLMPYRSNAILAARSRNRDSGSWSEVYELLEFMEGH